MSQTIGKVTKPRDSHFWTGLRKWKALGFGLNEEHTEQRQIYRKHKR
jgi:hypothetical protein